MESFQIEINKIIDFFAQFDWKVICSIFQEEFDSKEERNLRELIDTSKVYKEFEKYFKLLLAKSSADTYIDISGRKIFRSYEYREFDESPISSSEETKNTFMKFFISDLKMILLKEAVIELTRYYSRTYNRGKQNLRDELFIGYDKLMAKTFEFTKSFYPELEEIPKVERKKLNAAFFRTKEYIEYRMPKIALPWYQYNLLNTSEAQVSKDICIVQEKSVKLKGIKNDYPQIIINGEKNNKYKQILEESESNQRTFINALYENREDINVSLNLYLFNELTSLIDVNDITSIILDNYKDAIFGNKKTVENEVKEKKNFKKEVKKYADEFDDYAKELVKVTKINAWGVKHFFLYYFDKSGTLNLFNKVKIYTVIDELIKEIALCIKNTIKESIGKEDEKIKACKSEIKMYEYIYDALNGDDPYEELLNKNSSKNMGSNLLMLELYKYIYHYAYKNLFEAKYNNQYIEEDEDEDEYDENEVDKYEYTQY